MSSTIKKELILEGLDCANCATKIEDRVSKLEHVTLSSMNFATKTLTIEVLQTGDIDQVMNDTTAIVAKLEPDVVVKEKVITKAEKKILMLMGLGCANCAAKIEKEVKTIDGVVNATVDFVSKKLIISTDKLVFGKMFFICSFSSQPTIPIIKNRNGINKNNFFI